ncbi:hypothetical protein SAMN05428974_1200 [Sphingopyxis sp. YR583]|jgi:hypothetical protein|uniref:hypothetical protein n=1 Tax=Sphingopyxis sp. YR583 TaxID=1881047 RepID=UPI0008A760ED|nr:hypothetical protein [Sphingopyxis sp. YR583]SEH14486.1 hypothetical protein SAMN05428974_1200 [Sphingopyxis sp. YR583]
MANDAARAAFWRDFILARCGYPAPRRLAAQFDDCRFEGFCPCGCNSFAVRSPTDVTLVRPAKTGGAVFGTDFRMHDGRMLTVTLFSGVDGRLDMIDVYCDENSAPVPPIVDIKGEPLASWASKNLLLDLA